MISSKSPRTVAAVALQAGRRVFSLYSHLYSPHKFTQPQLFACLVLKDFEKKDYRGVCQLLEDCADLREAIGLKTVPHYTTLQKASRRLLKQKHVRRLVDDTVVRIRKRSTSVKYAAADSSGFDAHHASRYFILRTAVYRKGKEPKKRTTYKYYGKLMLIVCTATHAILAAVASRGPTPDVAELKTVLMELAPSQKLRHLVADAGFDSAYNHALLRESYGIRSTIPPETGRPAKDPAALPTNKYRRLMKTRFNTKAYRKRPQVETVISMLKRNFGSSLRGRSHWSRCRDMYLRMLTHNIALALPWVFYRAGHSTLIKVEVPFSPLLRRRPLTIIVNTAPAFQDLHDVMFTKAVRFPHGRWLAAFCRGRVSPTAFAEASAGPNSGCNSDRFHRLRG
jgi:hypothetical protein